MFNKAVKCVAIALFGLALCCGLPAGAAAQSQNSPGILPTADQSNTAAKIELPSPLAGGPEKWTSPEGISSTLQVMVLMSVLSLAPAIMLMTTCFVRVLVVLGILRQALGTRSNCPPTQVLTAASMFLTLLIMWPVWKQTYDQGVVPYTQKQLSAEDAWQRGIKPIRRFMSDQINRCNNSADIWMFYKYLPAGTTEPKSYDDVPLAALLPAFMISELKTAFLIGFQIYLAVRSPRSGRGKRHHRYGHAHAPPRANIRTLQIAFVRVSRRLAFSFQMLFDSFQHYS